MYRGTGKIGEILGSINCINGNIRVVILYQDQHNKSVGNVIIKPKQQNLSQMQRKRGFYA
jgi:hypothetical protein